MMRIIICILLLYAGIFDSAYALIVEDNFDEYYSGYFVEPSQSRLWTRKKVTPTCNWNDWTVQIDETVSHSPTNSLKIGQVYNNWQQAWAEHPLPKSIDSGKMTFYARSSGITDFGLRVQLIAGEDCIGYFTFGPKGEALANSEWRGDNGEFVIGTYSENVWYKISISWNGDNNKISYSFNGGKNLECNYITPGACAADKIRFVLHNESKHYYGWVDDILITDGLLNICSSKTDIKSSTTDQKLEPFLQKPKMDMWHLFSGGRFPNIVVSKKGTVLAFWDGVKMRRSEDGGQTWSDETIIWKGSMGGGVTVDETSGNILAFIFVDGHPQNSIIICRSQDDGNTWQKQETVIQPDCNGNMPSMHMNEHGITLQFGKYAGRLLRTTRWYTTEKTNWPQQYTNAIYSDDGGRTWKTSAPFPANGTGEAAVAELSDGTIYYNSRRHWAPEGLNPLRRWTALSTDGGQTWKDLSYCEILPDGDQYRSYGLMGGLARLPLPKYDILLFSNIESPEGRQNGYVWTSFDGGKTWPIKRLVYDGSFAYSSLYAGRHGTPSEGWIYLLFEGGPDGGGTVVRFNLSWLLGGELTTDGLKKFGVHRIAYTE